MNLALFAHPDDETLACGGLIARDPSLWHVAVLADGVGSRISRQQIVTGVVDGTTATTTSATFIDRDTTRQVHFKSAMQVLGIPPERYEAHGLPDQRLDTLDFLDLAKGVSQIIDRVQPDAVYTHFRGDLNMDHRLVCEAVHVACRPPESPAIYECEVPSSTEWGIGTMFFRPNVFVALEDDHVRLKLQAFACYKDEVREPPHPRSLRCIDIRAELWGSRCGVMQAEAFALVREIR